MKVDFVLILKSGESAVNLDRGVLSSGSEIILRKPEGIEILDLHRKSGELPSHLSRHTFALHRTDAAQI